MCHGVRRSERCDMGSGRVRGVSCAGSGGVRGVSWGQEGGVKAQVKPAVEASKSLPLAQVRPRRGPDVAHTWPGTGLSSSPPGLKSTN